MTPKELDEARVKEAWWLAKNTNTDPVYHAARLAREGWTPPEPVDPDILAFREWTAARHPKCETEIKAGKWDHDFLAPPFLAGARMAREQERERAKVLLRGLENIVDADQDVISEMAREALAKYEEGKR